MNVGVIMPANNAEKYIAEAIQSCLDVEEIQEIIIIDDGSTDNTAATVQSFMDCRILFLHHPNNKNLGRSASRNLGIKNSKSEWIIFCDADDTLNINRLTHLTSWKNKGIDGYYDDVGVFFESDVNREKHNFPQLIPIDLETVDMLDYLITHREEAIGILGLTIRKRALLRIGMFDEDLDIGEDTDLIWRLLLENHVIKFGGSEMPVAQRRVHQFNSYQDKDVIKKGRREFYQKWSALIEPLELSREARQRIESSHKYYNRSKLEKKLGGPFSRKTS